MPTFTYQCMICDGIYRTEQSPQEGVSHGYCSQDCYLLHFAAQGFSRKGTEDFCKGVVFDSARSVVPVSLETVVKKLEASRVNSRR